MILNVVRGRDGYALFVLALCAVLALLAPVTASGQAPEDEFLGEEDFFAQYDWTIGPDVGALGSIAEIEVPTGFVFAGAADTRDLMEVMQNPTDGSELGLIAPDNMDWFVVFDFTEDGYVRDNDKNMLDADKMLKAIREGTKIGNRERRSRGWPTLEVTGWAARPHYDEDTNSLVWAPKLRCEGEGVVNYNTRRLGRRGVMSVALVVDPPQLDEAIETFNELMEGFEYVDGERYADFRAGDKVATYGLAALVTGGAVAVAAKSGLLRYLGKGIIVVVVGIGAFFKRIFGRS